MTVRRFQLGANSFEVDVRGSELLVGVGKLNRPTLKARLKPSEAEARAEMDKLIAAHLARGYVEVEVPPDPEIARAKLRAEQQASDAFLQRVERERAARGQAHAEKLARAAYTPSRNTALEREAAHDAEARKVYVDWLLEAGDPRGTIAATFLSGDRDGAMRLCADLTPYGRITLEDGFAVAASVSGERLVDQVRALCGAGVACTVRWLRVGLADDGDWTPIIDAIAASPLAAELRQLDLDASDRLAREPDAYSEADDELYRHVAPVRCAGTPRWHELAALERVTIDGPFSGTLGMASTSLRVLTIRTSGLGSIDDLLALRSTAPNLEQLAVFAESLPAAQRERLQAAFGARLVTTGDTRGPARYGQIVE
ncbi:MAG TPA: hypothetical protein VFQ53_25885 [Kofleriaceae bacterium]|nr:hypothetical protein [Kofleriaceae bacterium]